MTKLTEKNNNSKFFSTRSKKMTLKGYYQNIPLRNAPRQEFIMKISNACHVTEQTVRNWVLYGLKPQQKEHIEFLSKITGIEKEDLW